MTKFRLFSICGFIGALVVGGALGQQASGTKQELPVADEASFVRFYVRAEARGTLAITDDGATITALRHAYKVSDPSKELPKFSTTQSWKLDFSGAKELGEAATKMDGKTVLVTGWGELRELWNAPEQPGAGSSFGRSPFPAASPYWIVDHTIVVSDLRLAE